MIDLATERTLSLGQAARLLPRGTDGRAVCLRTMYRWSSQGLKGTVLETVQAGRGLVTSVEAVQRFCEALAAARQRPNVAKRPRRDREREHAKAVSVLRDAGF